jgi:H+/Cl- antiporter ClcA
MELILGISLGAFVGLVLTLLDKGTAKGRIAGSIILGAVGGSLGVLIALLLSVFSGARLFESYNLIISLILAVLLSAFIVGIQRSLFRKDKFIKAKIQTKEEQ